jgi:hypothetical protein
MISFLFCFALISALLNVDCWHAKFFPQVCRASLHQFRVQSNVPSQGKFNLPKTKVISSLKFKVSESEEETEEDDEVIEFDDVGGSPILKKLSKGTLRSNHSRRQSDMLTTT